MTNSNAAPAVKLTIKGCLWITCGLIILEMKAENEPAISVPVYFKSVKKKNKQQQNKTKQNKPTKQKEKKVSSGGSRTPDLQSVRSTHMSICTTTVNVKQIC